MFKMHNVIRRGLMPAASRSCWGGLNANMSGRPPGRPSGAQWTPSCFFWTFTHCLLGRETNSHTVGFAVSPLCHIARDQTRGTIDSNTPPQVGHTLCGPLSGKVSAPERLVRRAGKSGQTQAHPRQRTGRKKRGLKWPAVWPWVILLLRPPASQQDRGPLGLWVGRRVLPP